jgi:hypothetical protein
VGRRETRPQRPLTVGALPASGGSSQEVSQWLGRLAREASSHPNFAHDASGGRVGGWLTVQLNVPEHHHLLKFDLHPIRPISAATASARSTRTWWRTPAILTPSISRTTLHSNRD